MFKWVRDLAGFLLLIVGCAMMICGVVELRVHDYLGTILLLAAGMSAVRASVDLLRVTVGE